MYSVHGKICTLLKLHFRRNLFFGYNLKEMVQCLVTQVIATTKRVQLSKTNSYFRKATATFIGRLSCLNMRDNEESMWRFSEYFFQYSQWCAEFWPNLLALLLRCSRGCCSDPSSKCAIFTVITKKCAGYVLGMAKQCRTSYFSSAARS